MAIDKESLKVFLKDIDGFFDDVIGTLSPDPKNIFKKAVMGPAIKEIENIVLNARPPMLQPIGRSRHGKSSLINALVGSEVVGVDDIMPQNPEETPLLVHFKEHKASWRIVDTRGIFESVPAEGAKIKNPVEHLLTSLKKNKPDIVFHVIAAPDICNSQPDLDQVKRILTEVGEVAGSVSKTILILSKTDTLGDPTQWPPETHPQKAGLIDKELRITAEEVLKVSHRPINPSFPVTGSIVTNSNYIGIIPVCTRYRPWNLETLTDFMGDYLPESAILNFAQAGRRNALLRKISSSLIKRFAGIASTVGITPIPVSDILILVPLQTIMVAMIGALSCRSLSTETAKEFFAATGINVAGGLGARVVAQQLVKFLPAAGSLVSAAIAGAGTYGLGKAAEAYFFSGEITNPEQYQSQWDTAEPQSQVNIQDVDPEIFREEREAMEKPDNKSRDLLKTILELARLCQLKDHQPGRVKLTVSAFHLLRLYRVLGGVNEVSSELERIPGHISHETSVGWTGGSVLIRYDATIFPADLWEDLSRVKDRPDLEAVVSNRLTDLLAARARR